MKIVHKEVKHPSRTEKPPNTKGQSVFQALGIKSKQQTAHHKAGSATVSESKKVTAVERFKEEWTEAFKQSHIKAQKRVNAHSYHLFKQDPKVEGEIKVHVLNKNLSNQLADNTLSAFLKYNPLTLIDQNGNPHQITHENYQELYTLAVRINNLAPEKEKLPNTLDAMELFALTAFKRSNAIPEA